MERKLQTPYTQCRNSIDVDFQKSKNEIVVAIDLGASSGRLIMGYLKEDVLYYEEIHRFDNHMIRDGHRYLWNLDLLFEQILHGLRSNSYLNIKSVGVDTWGVDYVLLDDKGIVLDFAYTYRDHRTDEIFLRTQEELGRNRIFEKTGLQLLQFNTLYQLKAHKIQNPEVFKETTCFLMLSDYFHYKLCGQRLNEFTQLSTSQMINTKEKSLDHDILDYIGVNNNLFPPMCMSGDILGHVTSELRESTGISKDTLVIAPCTHDTSSSIVASIGDDSCVYICSGTWSIIGTVTEHPVVTSAVLDMGYSNEGGAYGSNTLLKNIMGLWIINRVVKEMAPNASFDTIVQAAYESEMCTTLINPNDNVFFNPLSMVKSIQDYAEYTDQKIPKSLGEIARCVYNSLALLYNLSLLELEKIMGMEYKNINIVGGGGKNNFLNQLTANITGKTVVAGPIETSAIGNMVIQMISLGWIRNLNEGKRIIRKSEKLDYYKPQYSANMEHAKEIFDNLYRQVY